MPQNEGNTVKQRKPANTAFKQQRLKAWQPILTPKTVLPTFFILGLIFIPLGAVLLHVSNQVDELMFDYTDCTSANPQIVAPVKSITVDNVSGSTDRKVCKVTFTVSKTMKPPVFMYYRLTNFYQNHRRYVKSLSADQLRGDAISASQANDDCYPLDKDANGNIYYPCGLIANSLFNDTIGLDSSDFNSFTMTRTSTGQTYRFSTQGISWPSDLQKYKPNTANPATISPPKDWIGRVYKGQVLKETWAASNVTFDPQQDEHFQVWMRTAGLPTFRKLYGRNINTELPAGDYELSIVNDFKVLGFGGTKSIVISTTSFLGGKNPFLGISYLTVGCICLALGILFLVKHYVSPRKLGDHTYLSWNQAPAPSSAATTNPGAPSSSTAGDK